LIERLQVVLWLCLASGYCCTQAGECSTLATAEAGFPARCV